MEPSLDTVLEFVNTVHYEKGTVDDRLGSPADLAAFLRDHDLHGAAPAKPADLRRAVAVREAIRALLLANNGERLDPEAVELLNRTAQRARLGATFDGNDSWHLRPAAKGMDAALGELVAPIFAAMSDGRWGRVKACANPECGWAF